MGTRQVSATEFKAKCLRIIQEMCGDGRPVTITKRGCPVVVLSPLPPTDDAPPLLIAEWCRQPELTAPLPPTDDAPSFLGMMRGTVLGYRAPFAPAASPSDWSAQR